MADRHQRGTENVVLIRRGEGNVAYVTRLNVNEMISKGNGDVLLHPYDVVYVPRTIITELDIFVEQYIRPYRSAVPRLPVPLPAQPGSADREQPRLQPALPAVASIIQ